MTHQPNTETYSYRIIGTILAVTWLFVACVSPEPQMRPLPLNSERIKQRFGSYGIEVLHQDKRSRISNLYSTHQDENICRTFAVVALSENTPNALITEHARITEGESLGAIFKQNRWTISKETQYIGSIPATNSTPAAIQLMKLSSAGPLGIHIYDFIVQKNNQRFIYATIAEIHHPDYLAESDIRRIYETSSHGPNHNVPLRINRLLKSAEKLLSQTAIE